MSITPNEFLRFANEMGLGQIRSTSLTSLPTNNNGYTLTGLSVLNNLCHLIEHIHILKAENNRLHAHLDLVNHVDKFLLKTTEKKILHTNDDGYDEEKSSTLSPSNSLKIQNCNSSNLSILSKGQGEDSSSMIHIDHEQSEIMDNHLSSSTLPSWNKVRHALKFSLRRKQDLLTSPERIIPAISILVESDDEHSQDNKCPKKTKLPTIHTNRHGLTAEDTDQDDECIEIHNVRHKRQLYRTDRANSSSNERQEIATLKSTIDDDNLLIRKQSKIAHYRRKLRSKINTVKKQFSDPNTSSSLRHLTNSHGSTFNNIGSGLNHAFLTAKLAPAMTKSYQQKMREWQTMQKSNFLVNYRRQSVVNKIEFNNTSRKASIVSTINEESNEATDSSIGDLNSEIDRNVSTLSPTLSPNQRSLIVYQWREIMSEEIFLRHYNDYLQKKMQQLKQLEIDLKSLKTSIFCNKNVHEDIFKSRSMTSIEQLEQDSLNQYRQTYLPQRSRSYQSLVSMPASWILAVQSAAYSDILDGTSKKTTERAIIFNKNFFNQLKHFKDDRQHFEQDTFNDLQTSRSSKIDISYEKQSRTRILLTRGCLHKLSFLSPTEFSQPMIPLQTKISKSEKSSPIDLLPSPTISDAEPSLPSSNTTLHKPPSKRSRFDFRKTLQRSKSMCVTQFNSWLQRRRQQQQQHPSQPRRKSAIDSKTNKEMISSSCSTPKLLGSPRLARLHQKIFKQNPSPLEPPPPTSSISLTELPLSSSPFANDDSDQQFQKQEPAVRIYLPARTSPTTRHVRITEIHIKTPPMSKITSPIINRRRNLSTSIKIQENDK